MYYNILKEETSRILFQYINEYKDILNHKPISLDAYLKDIEIDIETYESYNYYSVVINNHFNTQLADKGNNEPNYKKYYKDFYSSVKKAFKNELKQLESEYITELEDNKEDLNYFKNRLYLNDEDFLKEEKLTEEERITLMEEYENQIKYLEKKVKLIKKAF